MDNLKYIKLFEKYAKMNEERYSLPEAVYELNQELVDFISSEFSKWQLDRSKNLSDYYFLNVKTKSDDFPVNRIKLKLVITNTEDYGDFNTTGLSHYSTTDDVLLKPMIKANKKFDLGIQIEIMVSEDADPSPEEVKREIESVCAHELFHSYQGYKRMSKSKNEFSGDALSFNLGHVLHQLYMFAYSVDFLNELINLTYVVLTGDETSAHLAQLHTKSATAFEWMDFFNKFKRMDYNQILNLCRQGVKNSNVSREEVFEKFVQCMKEAGTNTKKMTMKNFDDMVEFFYETIKEKEDYMTRKIAKIQHQTGNFKHRPKE